MRVLRVSTPRIFGKNIMKITLKNKIEISELSNSEKQHLTDNFTFENPKYIEAVKFGRSIRSIPKEICLADQQADQLFLPMGCLNYVLNTFEAVVNDKRCIKSVSIPFLGELRAYQETFVQDAINAGGGLMVAATGSGKTYSGLALASRLGQRTLILVKSKDLAKQWIDEIKAITGCDAGLIGGGKNKEGDQFTVALTQSLSRLDDFILSRFEYGLVIADEAHNLPANQAFNVINNLTAKYKYGLTATPQRRDGLEMMITASVGDVCAEVKQDQLDGKVLPVVVKTIELPFDADVDSWVGFLTELSKDETRNLLLVDHAIKSSKAVGTIILCAHVNHCEELAGLCLEANTKALVLHGQLPAKERAERMARTSESNLIIGTLSLLSEGVDLPHLGALIFGAPVSASIDKDTPAATRLIQSIGRVRRPYPNKSRAYVLDVIDKSGFGVSAWHKRRKIYQLQGFEVM